MLCALIGYESHMTSDPRRIVDDLEAKVVDESAIDAADEPSHPPAEDASPGTPGVEPTD